MRSPRAPSWRRSNNRFNVVWPERPRRGGRHSPHYYIAMTSALILGIREAPPRDLHGAQRKYLMYTLDKKREWLPLDRRNKGGGPQAEYGRAHRGRPPDYPEITIHTAYSSDSTTRSSWFRSRPTDESAIPGHRCRTFDRRSPGYHPLRDTGRSSPASRCHWSNALDELDGRRPRRGRTPAWRSALRGSSLHFRVRMRGPPENPREPNELVDHRPERAAGFYSAAPQQARGHRGRRRHLRQGCHPFGLVLRGVSAGSSQDQKSVTRMYEKNGRHMREFRLFGGRQIGRAHHSARASRHSPRRVIYDTDTATERQLEDIPGEAGPARCCTAGHGFVRWYKTPHPTSPTALQPRGAGAGDRGRNGKNVAADVVLGCGAHSRGAQATDTADIKRSTPLGHYAFAGRS